MTQVQLEKKEFKMTFIFAGSIITSACMICITLGVYLGDWQSWRNHIDEKTNSLQNWQNEHESAPTYRIGGGHTVPYSWNGMRESATATATY